MRIELGIPLSLAEIRKAIQALDSVSTDAIITAICTDSRECKSGDLFFALPGEHVSGEVFVREIEKIGAFAVSAAVSSENSLLVGNVTIALLSLAAYYKTKLNSLRYTVAITGSVGKTTLKETADSFISRKFHVFSTVGNRNSVIGVPLSVLSAPKNTEVLILEIGMNHKGEIEQIVKFLPPDLAVITNVGTAHIGNLGSREQIAKAKSEIAVGEPVLFPENEPLLSHISGGVPISISPKDQPPKENAIRFATEIARRIGFTENELSEATKAVIPFSRKNEYTFGAITVIEDAYNAAPESVEAGLEELAKATCPKTAVLGDMLELGGFTEEIHKKIGQKVASLSLDAAIFVGVYAPYYKAGAVLVGMPESKIYTELDSSKTESIVKNTLDLLGGKGTVYLKASHKLRLDRLVTEIKKQAKQRGYYCG